MSGTSCLKQGSGSPYVAFKKAQQCQRNIFACISGARHLVTRLQVKALAAGEEARVYDYQCDERYRRYDMATLHAYESRQAFVDCICDGPAHIDLAEAALAIAGEDDALSTHSTVPFPRASFRARITKLAQQCESRFVRPLPDDASPGEVIAAVESFLRDEQGFTVPETGRSGLPVNAVVDHPGVWEDARDAYLHELLIRKRGNASALCVLVHDVFRHLFLSGAIHFAVRVHCREDTTFPISEALKLPREMVALPGGTMLNTCSTDALEATLCHLKRAFWPFAWDTALDPPFGEGVGSQGGFRSAALEALDGPVSAAIAAIARAAEHRLSRGVWTSPGAGDLRRALAACERLVLLRGVDAPWERRDLGLLYIFRGMPERAKVELLAFSSTAYAREAAPPEERKLLGALLALLADVELSDDEDPPISVAFYQGLPPPDLDALPPLPLTW